MHSYELYAGMNEHYLSVHTYGHGVRHVYKFGGDTSDNINIQYIYSIQGRHQDFGSRGKHRKKFHT